MRNNVRPCRSNNQSSSGSQENKGFCRWWCRENDTSLLSVLGTFKGIVLISGSPSLTLSPWIIKIYYVVSVPKRRLFHFNHLWVSLVGFLVPLKWQIDLWSSYLVNDFFFFNMCSTVSFLTPWFICGKNKRILFCFLHCLVSWLWTVNKLLAQEWCIIYFSFYMVPVCESVLLICHLYVR